MDQRTIDYFYMPDPSDDGTALEFKFVVIRVGTIGSVHSWHYVFRSNQDVGKFAAARPLVRDSLQ